MLSHLLRRQQAVAPRAGEAMSADGRYPDFLVIGAQKAGTSWLFTQLSRHPHIWLPPTKEIHYFDDLWPDSHLLKHLSNVYANNINNKNIDFDMMMWHARFALERPRTDAWYASLFAPAGNRKAGDITPAYSMLDDTKVAHTHRLMPDAHIFFILREPIERLWSQFCFSTPWRHSNIPDKSVPLEFMIWEIDTGFYDLRTDYIRTIDLWSRHFGEEQFHVLFYEDVLERPGAILRVFSDCLDIPRLRPKLPELRKRINKTEVALARPAEVDQHFARKYLPMLNELERRFGGPVTDWRRRAEQAVA